MSEGFDLTTIAAVEELTSAEWHNQPDMTAVNAYLDAGWVLLATYTHPIDNNWVQQRYCLGWPRILGDVTKPTYKTRSQQYNEEMAERGQRMSQG